VNVPLCLWILISEADFVSSPPCVCVCMFVCAACEGRANSRAWRSNNSWCQSLEAHEGKPSPKQPFQFSPNRARDVASTLARLRQPAFTHTPGLLVCYPTPRACALPLPERHRSRYPWTHSTHTLLSSMRACWCAVSTQTLQLSVQYAMPFRACCLQYWSCEPIDSMRDCLSH
jgi:hypothetical protein